MSQAMYPNFYRYFSAEQRRDALVIETHKLHPIGAFEQYIQDEAHGIRVGEPICFLLANTEKALFFISRRAEFEEWLNEKIVRAGDFDNLQNACAAFAEIRALGSMIEMDLVVEPVRKGEDTTPDFFISSLNCYVEVHCKQMNEDAANGIKAFNAKPGPMPAPGGITFRSHCYRPMGGEDDETTVENLAQKFAQVIGDKNAQAKEGSNNIVWLDIQDQDMWGINAEYAIPVVSRNYCFNSGGLWLALYGKNDAPVFEMNHMTDEPMYQKRVLRFDGRFQRNEEQFDAAILSFPRELLVMQNVLKTDIDIGLWMPYIMQHSQFRFELSWIDWPVKDTLHRKVEKQIEMLRVISEKIFRAD
ncbi:MAG: hypothetical protein ACYDG3_12335 [Bacillati bacterium]